MQTSAIVLFALCLLANKASGDEGVCEPYAIDEQAAKGDGVYVCLDADRVALAGECSPEDTPEGTVYYQAANNCYTIELEPNMAFLPGIDPCGPCIPAIDGLERGDCYIYYGWPSNFNEIYDLNNDAKSADNCCNLGKNSANDVDDSWGACPAEPEPEPEPEREDLGPEHNDDDAATMAGAAVLLALTILAALF